MHRFLMQAFEQMIEPERYLSRLESAQMRSKVVAMPSILRLMAKGSHQLRSTPPKIGKENSPQHTPRLRCGRETPAPHRGELVRQFGNVLRQNKEPLAALVAIESGKIWTEALGEVQEMIDICDFAVGLSRQLYGLTMGSERPGHKLAEYWHPIGVVGVISAFNFPTAVWSWNTALALVCGDTVVWKPSEKTPLTAIASSELLQRTIEEFGDTPRDIHQLIIGDAQAGKDLVADPRVPVISATGSTAMGRKVGPIVAERFGRCILELGGNNAMIVSSSADFDMAVEAIVFAAVGTAGQRCTTLRRVIAHESIVDDLFEKVVEGYKGIRIGDPFHERSLVGPLIDKDAFDAMQASIHALKEADFTVHGGERVDVPEAKDGYYVRPAIVRVDSDYSGAQKELFAPLLYVMSYSTFDEAVAIQNNVPQGLSSAVFSNDIRETERFLSPVVAIVALRMSILGRAAPRSVGRLAERKKPVVVANLALMPGRAICVV